VRLARVRATLGLVLLIGTPLAAQTAGGVAAAPHGEAAALINSVRSDPNAVPIPALSGFTSGARTVAAGSTEAGPVAVVDGRLDVYGTVTGDAIAVHGDVVIHEGARVTGDAFAARGRVLLEGGVVDGEIRTLSGEIGPAATRGETASGGATVWRDLKLSLGWFAVLLAIGLGVLVTASMYLDGVIAALESSYPRALLAGIAGQLSIVPALILLLLGLAVTIVGILLAPFAGVAFVLALAGLVTLGFIAVAVVTGRSLGSRSKARLGSDRGLTLRALVVGISAYLFLWIAAAALAAWPAAALALRVVAAAVTWVAVTAGFGATLISRAGTRRPAGATANLATAPGIPASPATLAPEVPVWQTPTPVSGVVAARRPVAVQRDAE
jgi:hypothetical protein